MCSDDEYRAIFLQFGRSWIFDATTIAKFSLNALFYVINNYSLLVYLPVPSDKQHHLYTARCNFSTLCIFLLEVKCTGSLMFCNSNASSYAYQHNADISGNTFTVFSPNFPADYDSGTGFQWESESKCLLNVTNLPKHETLMIDMLHKSQGHVSNCDTPLPFSVLDDQMVELELHTVCPTNIGGTDRKRAITFTKSGEIAELQLILRKSNEGKAFQVNVTSKSKLSTELH